MSERYRYNQPAVVSEIIDGEAVIIHLDTGAYYSARGASAVIWDGAGKGATVDELVAAVCARFDADRGVAAKDVSLFIRQLISEGLLAPRGEVEATFRVPATDQARLPYAAPALERFDDMKDLLLADPIHDVDAAGWPHRPKT